MVAPGAFNLAAAFAGNLKFRSTATFAP